MSWRNLPGWSSDIVDGPDAFYPWLAKQLPHHAVHVEVGVFMFRSAACLAALRPDVTIVCIDPWEDDYKHLAGVDLVDLGGLKEDADILNRMSFYDAAITLFNKHIAYAPNMVICRTKFGGVNLLADSIFIDADHTWASAYNDLRLADTMLKPGGILCGHDYTYTVDGKPDPRFNPNPLFPGLVQAIDEFAQAKGKRVVVGAGSKTDWSTCWRLEDKC